MDYNNIEQTEDVDKKIEREWSTLQKRNKIFIFITIIIVLFFTRETILFWIKFSFPISKGYESSKIDISKDPIQINYSGIETERNKFKYKSLVNGHEIYMYPRAKYKIAGTAIAYNYSFFIRNEFFDSAALYDLGLAWGKLGEKNFYNKYFECYSQKNEMSGARVLWTKYKNSSEIPVSMDYVNSHFSHSHIVPANRNIMAAMLKIRRWDKVELEGELVDMIYYSKNREYTANTSLSRYDTGMGACETFYVTKVKIGNRVYK